MLLVVAGLLGSPGAFAAGTGSKEEAKAMAIKAAALYKTKGADAFPILNDKKGAFIDRDLYVAVLDSSGLVLAHGANERLVGKPLNKLQDADGKYFVQELAELVKANKAGWVDYRWVNPVTKEIEPKSSYIVTEGGYGLMVGAYNK
jgi:hypothetical protein